MTILFVNVTPALIIKYTSTTNFHTRNANLNRKRKESLHKQDLRTSIKFLALFYINL